jgi:tetratricopeptide (TPR) repeat protein
MKYHPHSDDDLLRNVLYRVDVPVADPALDSDVGDELFELFVEGRLAGADRDAFLHYLDGNPAARRAVAAYMELKQSETAPAPAAEIRQLQPQRAPTRHPLAALREFFGNLADHLPWAQGAADSLGTGARSIAVPYVPQAAFAMAAMLLIATVAVVWLAWQSTSGPMIAMGPHPNLMDYGRHPDGTLQMGENGDDAAALHDVPALLQSLSPAERQPLLDAFELLRRQRSGEAVTAFQRIVEAPPSSNGGRFYAWLGQGTALYMEHRFAEAQDAFRKALEIAPHSTAARINLIMALIQGGDGEQAVVEWQQLDKTQLAASERAALAEVLGVQRKPSRD